MHREGFQELLSACGSVYSLVAEHGHSRVLCALARQLGVFTPVSIPMSGGKGPSSPFTYSPTKGPAQHLVHKRDA